MMRTATEYLAPHATNMIRLDHTHLVTAFHQYRTTDSPRVKRGLVDQVCLALEVHAQLEEEIFYPALRAVAGDEEALQKSVPEHDEMKRLIGRLRGMAADDAAFDDTFMELLRDVLHHVADEETILLPLAERRLHDRLGELGLAMTKRRMELLVPRTGELASAMARSMSLGTLAATAAVTAALTALCLRRHAPR
ncbi:hemerythrin HHE cation binding domain-containing protein [Pseudacidovorax intermedius]|uniref:Hemerythrin HHE cation binding domain-containing protein n=1 Tax=Pseudacidovorax intermedius TaxID=433924 RepID=A0A370FQW2_9BURK|nr:hemerythrin HHE cation binding domain-containing protein [Pseudacidovorax intermedius]